MSEVDFPKQLSGCVRSIGEGLLVERGPFGRPVVSHSEIISESTAAPFNRLRSINEVRVDIRTQFTDRSPNYFIVVPTLRCNISCKYCQVSRVAETATGFDWSDEVLSASLDFMCSSPVAEITVEFQGGEPLLRLDLIKAVIESVSRRGKSIKAIICTNLQEVSEEAWSFFENSEVLISTSFDGTWLQQETNRTPDEQQLSKFQSNLTRALEVLGSDRVSLTSTFNPRAAPIPEDVFRAFRRLNMHTMFIRPVNYLGFARKAFGETREDRTWDQFYLNFLEALIEHNKKYETALGEYYFSYLLRRVLDPRRAEHVDLRNPSPLGCDYFVINETGNIFPTDEARMLYRTGQIDLRIGHVLSGLDASTISVLNQHSDNRTDADCRKCVYQAICGRDLIDDISRYGTIDMPRHRTRHCQRHLSIFDYIMRKLATSNEEELAIIAAMAGLPRINNSVYRSKDV